MAAATALDHDTERDRQRAGDDASASTQGRGQGGEQGDELRNEPADQRGGKPGGERGSGAMTLIEHLQELRRRLLISVAAIGVGSVVGFLFWDRVLGFLLSPLPHLSSQVYKNGQLIVHDPGEPFTIALKLALAVGLVLTLPVTLCQTWAFIAPGLTWREKQYRLPFMALGVGLFAADLAVGFVVLRWPLAWLIAFGGDCFVLLLDADSYFSFVAYFLLAFGLVSSRVLRAKRICILFGLWFLSNFITPGADQPLQPGHHRRRPHRALRAHHPLDARDWQVMCSARCVRHGGAHTVRGVMPSNNPPSNP